MNTPPPEEPFALMSIPSMSTPSHPAKHLVEKRPRRHTISRPDSALGHIPEGCASEDMTETFDRISGILSSLLQEANEAINGSVDNERPITTSYDNDNNEDDQHSEMLPLETTRSPTTEVPSAHSTDSHTRDSSISSTFSSSATDNSFSVDTPVSLYAMTPPMTPKPSGLLSRKEKTTRPLSCPMILRSSPSINVAVANHSNILQQVALHRDPLAESYKRLDQSLAAVDSLSRDLIPQEEISPSSSAELIPASSSAFTRAVVKLDLRLALLILPFIHIPHAFISMIYDTLFSNDLNNLPGILAWCIFYCLASLAMDRAVMSQYMQQHRRRRSSFVPGSYAPTELIPPPINTQPAVLYPRRSNRRVVVVPRRSSIYRKTQPQQSPLGPTQDTPSQLVLKPSASSLAITRTSAQHGSYMPATPTYGASPTTMPIFVRRNSF